MMTFFAQLDNNTEPWLHTWHVTWYVSCVAQLARRFRLFSSYTSTVQAM